MRSPEELLEAAAADGSFDSNEWPRVLDFVLSRLKESVYNEFPRPSIGKPSQVDSPRPTTINLKNEEPLSQESQTADKENNPPQHLQQTRSQSAIETQGNDGDDIDGYDADFPPEVLSSYHSIRSTLAQSFTTSPPYTIQRLAELILHPRQHYRFLPAYLYALNRVLSVSSSTEAFPLPQAVLSASSGLLNGTGASVSTPSSTSYSAASNLGSDESLGGALLTPIPWLRPERDHQSRSEFKPESTETVDGPNGTGTIETVSVVNGHLSVVSTTRNASASATAGTATGASAVPGSAAPAPAPALPAPTPSSSLPSSPPNSLRDVGGVTQGELLRQEQEAGIIPVTQQAGQRLVPGNAGAGGNNIDTRSARGSDNNSSSNSNTNGSDNNNNNNGEDEDEDNDEDVQHPHARGPEDVGMEDTGPQSKPPGSALDLTAAVGRPVVLVGQQGGDDITMGEGMGEGQSEGKGEGQSGRGSGARNETSETVRETVREDDDDDDEMKEDRIEDGKDEASAKAGGLDDMENMDADAEEEDDEDSNNNNNNNNNNTKGSASGSGGGGGGSSSAASAS